MLPTPPSSPLLTSLDRGSLQFSAAFRAFSGQFTQPQLLRLSSEYLGTRAIHSSQIGGFRDGRLVDPAPKVFVALGYLNVALAYSIGHPHELIEPITDIGYTNQLPAHLRDLWEYRIPILDVESVALGPSGLFQAFCGLRELPASTRPRLDAEEAAEASRVLGAFLRSQFAKHDIDWFESLGELSQRCPTIEPLLLNKGVSADRLLHDLDAIGACVGFSGNALWEHIQGNLGR